MICEAPAWSLIMTVRRKMYWARTAGGKNRAHRRYKKNYGDDGSSGYTCTVSSFKAVCHAIFFLHLWCAPLFSACSSGLVYLELFGWLVSQRRRQQLLLYHGLTILLAAAHETELGDHDFCLSRSHYTDTDPTSRERAVTKGIEPRTSSPGVARSTDLATAPHISWALWHLRLSVYSYGHATNNFFLWQHSQIGNTTTITPPPPPPPKKKIYIYINK